MAPTDSDTALISAIRSGGQSGADRGALDAASAHGVAIVGLCPGGGGQRMSRSRRES
ncbi:MAG TPA: putative molybdenum carrier protein [Candidatus Corynebacterium avicola]|uniref:Molybdenum carrier protein n=1 Tax=Candidatus Corynebacterium avicola TaxID=2838527 RepID=A0A9D1RP46_9CORY|nr:putative molybdenum carrier protein [Candidatus Corynebacterium avicola]